MYAKWYATHEIAAAEGVPANSVAERYTQQISTVSNLRSGQPKKVTEADKRRIRRMIKATPFISNKEIISTIPLHVCVKTLTSYLMSEGIQRKLALRRPKLTPHAAARKLKFALEYRDEPIEK